VNNKDLKNKLKSEIESIAPRVYDNVVSSSYIEKPETAKKKKGVSKAFRIAMSATACVLIVAIAITCGVMFAPKKDNPISNYYYVQVSAGAGSASAADEESATAKVTLTLNNRKTVETVRAENVDGDMILHLTCDLTGLKFDAAIGKIRSAALSLKFVSDTDGLAVSISGEDAENFINDVKSKVGFSLSIKTISKDDLVNEAKKYFENASSSMSFEQLTAVFADRKDFLEESWFGDRSVFSDVYYKFAEERISKLDKGLKDMFLSDFQESKSSYSEMIKKLNAIESLCAAISPEWKDKVQEIRETIEGIDFQTIKGLYETYLSSTIDNIINNEEKI